MKADELCREDTRPLLDANVVKGAKLLLERDETCYPVTILDVQSQKGENIACTINAALTATAR